MRNSVDGSTRPSAAVPTQVFTSEYLALLAERDEPLTAGEADTAGPWRLEATRSGWLALLREGESLDRDAPFAILNRLDVAQLAAAILPGTGRERRYRLGPDPDEHGFPLFRSGERVGHLRLFDEEVAAALNVVDALLSAPRDLSWLYDAAGGIALEHSGRIALARALAPLG